jgi:large subunit ribosomal protein L17
MRHQKKRHKLGRTAAHRKATLAAMATALIEHKRIETTLAKAKALRTFVEPLITRAKDDTTHNRRQVFRRLRDKKAVTELFGDIAAEIGDRPGGYTRVIKLGQRQGDNAEMAVIELVDWNDVKPEGAAGTKKKTRRGGTRRGKATEATQAAKPSKAPKAAAEEAEVEAAEEPEVAEEPAAEAAEEPAAEATEEADVAEEPEAAEEPAAEAAEEPAAEEVKKPGPEVVDEPEPAAKGTSSGMHDAPATASDPEVNEHPDAPQGADPGTGSPAAEFGKGDQGVAGGSRHRG